MTTEFKNNEAIQSAIKRASWHLIPPPNMLPSVWAEQNIVIPVGNAIPGPISFDNAPYQRGMIDVIKTPGVYRVSFMTGAQLGKTTIQQCITSFFIAHEPRSQIFLQPTQGDVHTFLETKLRPMIQANRSISDKMAKPRGREGVSNSRMISFVGGFLIFAWAGSTNTLRGRSAPITQADEVDSYEITAEGDALQLLYQRGATFGDQRLQTESSTPTIKGASRIETGFQEGDQRRYYVPCPDCDGPQFLKWSQVRWDGRQSTSIKECDLDLNQDHKPETAHYVCEHCGSCWDDGMRIAAIRNAERNGHGWKAAKPFKGHASFHAPEMLSTFRRLRDISQSYLDKLAVGDVQSFQNVSLGETFEETGEKADPDSLYARREQYRAQVPAGGLFLTCGIDMQQDRLEAEVVAWGVGEESWGVEKRVFWGDVLTPDPWEELTAFLDTTWQHESGAVMTLGAACIDTGGNSGMTQAAYDYCKGKTGRRLFAIKGGGTWGSPVVQAPQRKQSGKFARKVDLFIVGADETKLIVMRRLSSQTPGPGYCHFPMEYEKEDFLQLTAEKLITRLVKGFPVREWHKTRDRNEGLDCRVYAYAALKIINPSMKRLAERLKVPENDEKQPEIEKKPPVLPQNVVVKRSPAVEKQPEKAPEIPPQEAKPAPADNRRIKRSTSAAKRKPGGWVNSWR